MNDHVWFVINIQMLYYYVIHFCIISFRQKKYFLFTVLLIVCFWHKSLLINTNGSKVNDSIRNDFKQFYEQLDFIGELMFPPWIVFKT